MFLRVSCLLLLSLIAYSMGACSSGSNGRPLPTVGSSLPSTTVRSLLSPAPDAFQVVYSWTDSDQPDKEGTFVLRHRGTRERWDWIGASGARRGSFDIMDGQTTAGCDWDMKASSEDFIAGCSVGRSAAPGSNALQLALAARVTNTLDSRQIAGYVADCYAFKNLSGTPLEVCVEPSLHILLYLSGRTGIVSNKQEVMTALSVSQTPLDAGDDALGTTLLPFDQHGQFTDVPRSALHLPAEFKIGP